MSDELETVWSADPHTIAKHQILQAYLNAWLPILSAQSRNVGATQRPIKYVDGFAGPGVYAKGEKGSPILALETTLHHAYTFPVPVDLIFVEADKQRHAILKQELERYSAEVATSKNVQHVKSVCGDCRDVLGAMLDEAQRAKFGPALVFLDQFGYSAVPMDLISRILSQPQCEVLTFFFWRELDRFISDPGKHIGVTAAFGGNDWQPAISLSKQDRPQFMQDCYVKCLKDRGKAKYVWPFAMTDQNSRLLCWLFFCTNAIRGLEEMKKAMWKVDTTGGFSFSDKHGLGQLALLSSFDEARLAGEMKKKLAGNQFGTGKLRKETR